MNWQELTKIEQTAGVKLYPAQQFIQEWKKNWQHKKVHTLPFVTSCCAIEMTLSERDMPEHHQWVDWQRLPFNQGPVLVIFSGTLTYRLVAHLNILKQMLGDNYLCMMLGGCAIGQGPYQQYANVAGPDELPLRLDVFVPGCPPTPQAVHEGMNHLEQKLRVLMDEMAGKAVH